MEISKKNSKWVDPMDLSLCHLVKFPKNLNWKIHALMELFRKPDNWQQIDE